MIRDDDFSKRIGAVIFAMYPEACPDCVVFFEPKSKRYLAAYEGGEGKIRVMECQQPKAP